MSSGSTQPMVLLSEPPLRAAVGAFVDHYDEERPHQRLGNELIAPKTTVIGTEYRLEKTVA